MLSLLAEVRGIQRHTRRCMPLLVDENIFYRVFKLMHGISTSGWDVRQWLCSLPLLYGVWHPYKYCVLAVYRAFFPIFAILETTCTEVGRVVNGKRKVLHIEKLVCCLLLLRHKISARAQSAMVPNTGDVNAACSQQGTCRMKKINRSYN